MDQGCDRPARPPLGFHDVCARYGVTPRALRYYESLEILSPWRMGPQRLYDARQQVRLELTLRGRRYRLKLEEIRQIIDLYDSEGAAGQARRWCAAVRRQRDALRAERAESRRVLEEMEATLRAARTADA